MTPEQYQIVTDLFSQATQVPQDERTQWIAENCSDEQIKDTLMSMLETDEDDDPQSLNSFDFVPKIDLDKTLPPDTVRPATVPTTRYLGNYELVEELGRGSMGVVFKARQKTPDRFVALKTIRAGRLASEADVKRFVNESQAAAKLDHDGIVPVYEVGCENGAHYYSMQFIEGTNFESLIKDGSKTREELVELFTDVCDAVGHCHENGIIHRDLKPSNILIDARGRPKVADFGLARNLQDQSSLTATGDVMGTPGYMPPEQALGDPSAARPTADVYSLGAILYHILTGRPPILARDVNLAGAIQLVRDHEVVAPKFFDRKIARNLDTICSKCLEKDPSKRYRNAVELAADLRAHLDGEPIQARGLNGYRRIVRWARQQPGLAAAWAAIGLIFGWHVLNYYFIEASSPTRYLHLAACTIAMVWAFGAWCFQRALMFFGGRSLILFAWATMDVLLLAALMAIPEMDGAKSYLTFLFFPIVAVASLRMRIDLVVFVTVISVVTYWFHVIRNNVSEQLTDIPPSGAIMFSLSLVTLGMVQYFSLRRSRFAIESFTKRPKNRSL